MMNDKSNRSYRFVSILVAWALAIATVVYAVGYRNADAVTDDHLSRSDHHEKLFTLI